MSNSELIAALGEASKMAERWAKVLDHRVRELKGALFEARLRAGEVILKAREQLAVVRRLVTDMVDAWNTGLCLEDFPGVQNRIRNFLGGT